MRAGAQASVMAVVASAPKDASALPARWVAEVWGMILKSARSDQTIKRPAIRR
jgi:hypothetical protein